MNIWTTVGTSLVIMVISTLLVLGDKIIGQNVKTPPPENISPLKSAAIETSSAPFDQDAFEIQQDIILKLSQRIAELEAETADKKAKAIEDDVSSTEFPLENQEEDFAPSALPLESPAPAPAGSMSNTTSDADIPLNEFTPYPEARQDYGESLDPYGEWFATKEYGDVWQPSTVRHDMNWAPYTNGNWHSTDLGWHFTSNDPWGWACYHYGRWVRYHHIGWCWIPGRQWAPAWVSWRVSDHYVGWCPLPPSATWSSHVGIGHWVDARCNLGPSHYNFVSINHFGNGHCRPHIIDRRTNFSLILSTRNITLIASVQNTSRRNICNYGPSHDFVSHRQGRKISRLHVRAQAGSCGVKNHIDHDTQHLIAHRLENKGNRKAPLTKLRPLQDANHDNGWNTITDKEKISKLRKHIVTTAQLQKVQQLPIKVQSDKMTKPPGVKQAVVHQTPPLKGIGVKPESQEGIVRKIIPRATPLEKNHNEKKLQNIVTDTPVLATNKPLLQDKRQQQDLLRKRAEEAKRAEEVKRTRAAEEARRNAIAQQQKQQDLLRKRAEEDKRTRAIEEARRNAIAQQQKQQELLRKRAEEDKRTRAIEEARRNAIAQQQKQQELLRRRAEEAKRAEEVKRTRAIEEARRNAIATQQKQQELLRRRAEEAKRAEEVKRTRAAEEARRNAIAAQQKQQELLRKRAEEAKRAEEVKRTRAIEEARRNAIAQQQKQQELLRRRAEEDKRTRAIEEARRNAIAQQQKQQELLRRRAEEAKRTRAIEEARRNAIAQQQKQQELLRKRAEEAKRTRAIEEARRNAIAQQQKQQELLRKRSANAGVVKEITPRNSSLRKKKK